MRFMQLKHDPNAVVRKKLIKSGKKWAVVSALSFAGVLLGGTLTGLDVNADVVGTSDISNPDSVVNTGTEKKQSKSVTANVTINSNLGEETVNNVTGEVGQTVTITVPAKEGYRADKSMIVATVNDDGTITTDESVNYTAVETAKNEVAKPEVASKPLEDDPDSSTVSADSASQMNTQSVAQKTATVSDVNSESDNLDDGGKFGDSSWYIDNGGTLHIGAGELGPEGSANWRQSEHLNDITTVKIDPGAIANSDSSYLFSGMSNVTSIDGIGNLDTRNVTNMSYMFSTCEKIQSLDLSNWDTSNVTNMSDMFHAMGSLEYLNLSSFNTEKVTDMSFMFYYVSFLNKLDLSSFDTSNVTDMKGMFEYASSVESILWDPDKFNTSNVTDMSGMFDEMGKLKSVDISKFDTSKVTYMPRMFAFDDSLESLDLSSFDTSSLAGQTASTNGMLGGTNLYKIKLGKSTGLSSRAFLIDGDWQAVGSGTESNPQGKKYTAAQIMTLYSTMPAVAETYVRLVSQVSGSLDVETLYSDKADKGSIPVDNLSGVPGGTFTVNITVPAVAGYIPYKNGTEKLVADKDGNYTTSVSAQVNGENDFSTSDTITYVKSSFIGHVIAKTHYDDDQQPDGTLDLGEITGDFGTKGTIDISDTTKYPLPANYSLDNPIINYSIDSNGNLSVDTINYIRNKVGGMLEVPTSYDDKGEGIPITTDVNELPNTPSSVEITVPSVDGYTPYKNGEMLVADGSGIYKTMVDFTIDENGEVSTSAEIHYKRDKVSGTVEVPTSYSDKADEGSIQVDNLSGVPGDALTVNITVPAVDGYTPYKNNTEKLEKDKDGNYTTSIAAQINGDNYFITGDSIVYRKSTFDVIAKTHYDDGEEPDGTLDLGEITGDFGSKGTIDISDTTKYPLPTNYSLDNPIINYSIGNDGTLNVGTVEYKRLQAKGPLTVTTKYDDGTPDGSIEIPDVSGTYGSTGNSENVTNLPVPKNYTTDTKSVTYSVDDTGNLTATSAIEYKRLQAKGSLTVTTKYDDGTPDGSIEIPDVTGAYGSTNPAYDISKSVSKDGYSTNDNTIPISIDSEGKITTTGAVHYTKNTPDTVTADVTIKSNQGDQIVENISGKPGDQFNVTVPTIAGYTSDKATVDVTVNADGTITVNDPDNAGYVTYTKTPTNNGGGGSSTPTPTKETSNVNIDLATFADRPAVQLYDSNGNLVSYRALKSNTDWHADKKMTKDGISYYRVASNEWVKMDDVYVYNSDDGYIETYNDSNKDLLNAHQIKLDSQLRLSSGWVTDVYTYMNGVKYYRVGRNEFVSSSDVFKYTPIHAVVQTNNYNVTVYNERGNAVTNRQLKANSGWRTDKLAVINGVQMYRVATDEWVKAADVSVVKDY